MDFEAIFKTLCLIGFVPVVIAIWIICIKFVREELK